ncbi:NAD(P)H-dependent oxidoreductase [Streptomyces mutabilis]|uniref:FMN-dependent NADH-azoreductase n=1 Tax=Streptomyces mutabilis TaxID=67332 RepID=UPI0022BA1CA2|nr:NAD(P)H-dependent oxidoreductase [Streptomyces mutabilis]MCZ9353806.1 NAD(P)H-dependent oxidoreductase [Streptomyces mutabilis]
MARLLHIDSSSARDSVSRALAVRFREVWDKEHGPDSVTYRDLVADPVPHLDGDAVVTLWSEPHTEAQRATAALQNRLVEEILAADALLVSVPMYNWTVPSGLKAWLDQSLILGRTLPYDPSHKPLDGRPATVLTACGGYYGADVPEASMDHCRPYLATVLGQVLGYELETITVWRTLAAAGQGDAEERRAAEESLRAGQEAAQARARAVAASLAEV